jgi:hypothetical protein
MRKMCLMKNSLNSGAMYVMRRRLGNNKGIATIEVVILIAIAILLLALFKDQAMALVSKVWAAINKGAGGIMQ